MRSVFLATNSPKKPSVKAMAKAFIIANPLATNAQIIKATGCSPSIPSMARNELRAAGFHVRAAYDQTTPGIPGTPGQFMGSLPQAPPHEASAPEPEKVPMRGTAEIMDLLDEEATKHVGEMTLEWQRKFLTQVSRDKNEPVQLRMAAMAAYNKLAESTSERDALGPGKPLTDKDRITRLSLLMKACGPTLVLKAYEEAFNVSAEEPDEEAMDSGDDTEEAEGATPSTGHPSPLSPTGEADGTSGLGQGDAPIEPTNPS